MTPIACTIVSNNYLPFARVFARSFLEHHPGGEVHVLIVDRPHPRIDYLREPFKVTFADELPIPQFQNFVFRYSVLELNTAVKPFFLQYLHERTQCPALCYFDPDILVTADLSELYHHLESADVVLTPHVLEPADDGFTPGDRDFLLSGTYNLGFLGISWNADTRRFLDWWQKKLHRYCYHQVDKGLFVDQRWMDLAPAFLPRPLILRDEGYNVAYWNVLHRTVEHHAGRYQVGGKPLRFFHFSGYHPYRLEAISKHQNRFTLSQRPDLRSIFEHYRERLLAEGYDELIKLPYGWATFDNGVSIPPAARRLLAEEDPEGERWHRPFDASSAKSYFRWLAAPREPKRALAMPGIAAAIWDSRADVRQAFPRPWDDHLLVFSAWFLDQGAEEEQVDEAFLEELRRSFEESETERRELLSGTVRQFKNGVDVPTRLVAVLARIDPHGARWPRPLSVDVDPSLYDWLRESEIEEPIVLPRIAFLIWEEREDLRGAFPEPKGVSAEAFGQWLLNWGVSEEGLTEPFLGALRSSLENVREKRFGALFTFPPGERARVGVLADEDVEWLAADPEADRMIRAKPRLTRLALLLHARREDLQRAFPSPLGASRRAFAEWYAVHGRRELDLPRGFVRPVLRDLSWADRFGILWRRLLLGLGLGTNPLSADAEATEVRGDEPASRSPGGPRLRTVERRWERLLDHHDEAGNDLSPLNLFIWWVWSSSPYLRREFPLESQDDRFRLLYWVALVNDRQFGIQSWLLPVDWRWLDEPAVDLGGGGDKEPLTHFQWLVWALRPDLRQRFPLATAAGREAFRQWMAASGHKDHARELALIEQKKTALPASGGVPGGLGSFAAGVNLVEHPKATLGIREDTRLNRLALECAGVACSHCQMSRSEEDPQAASAFRYRTNLIHSNADQMLFVFGQLGPQLFADRYTIGYWLWELSRCPRDWRPAFELVDEIWVPSRFVYEAFAPVSPVPVVLLPYPVVAEADASLSRWDFGLPEASFLFITTFDISSYAARKNPMATIEAFRRAFPPEDRRVGLVVKAAHAKPSDPDWRTLLELAEEDPRLHLVNEVMDRERLLAMVRLSDCYVSLHRAEGFGRGPAEAMLLGKPTIVTGYSGNLDYCTAETACLVDYDLVPVREGEYPFFEDQVWAEPNVDHAAQHMRRVFEDEHMRNEKAKAGEHFIRSHYGPQAVGERYAARLRFLGLL